MKITAEQDITQAIRERAYALWQSGGSPHGKALDFWLAAEAQVAPKAAKVARPKAAAVGKKTAKKKIAEAKKTRR